MREPLAKLGGGGENRVGVGVSPGRWPLPQDPSPPGHFPPPTSRIKRVPSPGAASDPRV